MYSRNTSYFHVAISAECDTDDIAFVSFNPKCWYVEFGLVIVGVYSTYSPALIVVVDTAQEFPCDVSFTIVPAVLSIVQPSSLESFHVGKACDVCVSNG